MLKATATDSLTRLVDNVEQVIYGKREEITLAVVGLLCQGHVLLEDVPGTGKTTLARALARSIDATFRRIQFTSDLIPADVLGASLPSSQPGSGGRILEFQPGPIFGNVVLADELNRTTPRTQSALLECMNEASISVEGVTRELPSPFLVIATQNPLDFEGTYPLPESQLDRFLVRVRMGYPARDEERRILAAGASRTEVEDLEPVLGLDEVQEACARAAAVRVDPALLDDILDIVSETRRGDRFLLGASPRAALGLLAASRAYAVLSGRDFCIPDDVKKLAVPVLGHRLVSLSRDGQGGYEAERELRELLDTLAVPD